MINVKEVKGQTSIFYLSSIHTKSEFHFMCPCCGTEDYYIIVSPKFCSTCHNALPEFSKLKDNLVDRVLWHFEKEIDNLMVMV